MQMQAQGSALTGARGQNGGVQPQRQTGTRYSDIYGTQSPPRPEPGQSTSGSKTRASPSGVEGQDDFTRPQVQGQGGRHNNERDQWRQRQPGGFPSGGLKRAEKKWQGSKAHARC